MEENKLEKLKKLLEVANEGLTREEFLKSFKAVMDQVLAMEKSLIEKIDYKTQEEKDKLEKLTEDFNQIIEEAKLESDSSLGGIRKKTVDMINQLFIKNDVNKKLNEQLTLVSKRLNQIRDGENGYDGVDGKDADEEKIVTEVLSKIELPKDNKEDIKKLEQELADLKEELDAVKLMKGKGGGGTSAIGIANAAKYFVKTEAPVGLIDGANKAYTVNKTIFAVLSFSLNGEFISQIPNYTVAGNTITFSTALPVSYSGKDFEITYI